MAAERCPAQWRLMAVTWLDPISIDGELAFP